VGKGGSPETLCLTKVFSTKIDKKLNYDFTEL
jgi:hypothetical protein